ncbi:MAG: ribonuclease III [Kiritimatiellae bacterium]|nr:ribonuclease III [Kiritimatiellia bacterium]
MTLLGYEFRDSALAEEALTTPSYKMTSPRARDNQRLEFLGDAVLGFVAADWLFKREAGEEEGLLTSRRQHMVSSSALAAAGEAAGLPALLRRNKGAAPLPPGAKAVADAVEAVIGAAWLDGGLEAAKTVFDTLGLQSNSRYGELDGNPKSALQHYSQALIPPRTPVYKTLNVSGTADKPVFTVEVSIAGAGAASGEGRNKKEAESNAAAALFSLLGANA